MRELIFFSLYVVSTLLIPFLSQWIFGALMRTLEVLKRMDDDYGVGVLLLIIPGDLPNPGIEVRFPTLQVDSLLSEPPGKPFSVYELIMIFFLLDLLK